jgi:hypothetical protein
MQLTETSQQKHTVVGLLNVFPPFTTMPVNIWRPQWLKHSTSQIWGAYSFRSLDHLSPEGGFRRSMTFMWQWSEASNVALDVGKTKKGLHRWHQEAHYVINYECWHHIEKHQDWNTFFSVLVLLINCLYPGLRQVGTLGRQIIWCPFKLIFFKYLIIYLVGPGRNWFSINI